MTDRFYHQVPHHQREALAIFRQNHPVRTENLLYIDTEKGSSTLLILTGGLRVSDAAFQATTVLEKDFRVIVPTYSALNTMTEMVSAIKRLLESLKIEKVHILAGSFGGMVAHVFVSHYPEMVEKLVLSSTGLPNETVLKSYRQSAQLLKFLPAPIAKNLSKQRLLKILAVPPDQALFWQAFLNELFATRLTKADILSTFYCILDFAHHHRLPPNWHGKTLILGATDDKTFDANAQNNLHAFYPAAHLHTFDQAGHSPSMTRPEEYFAVVRNFLL